MLMKYICLRSCDSYKEDFSFTATTPKAALGRGVWHRKEVEIDTRLDHPAHEREVMHLKSKGYNALAKRKKTLQLIARQFTAGLVLQLLRSSSTCRVQLATQEIGGNLSI